MLDLSSTTRFLQAPVSERLHRPPARLQPLLAKKGPPNIDLEVLAISLQGVGVLSPAIAIDSPAQWKDTVEHLGPEVDGILPVSVPAYPTEIWNSHPDPLVERRLPFIFWPLAAYDEPDFWRWSARDFLSSLGVDVHLVQNIRQGLALVRALAMRRFLKGARLVVFGEQNFPWNAPAAGHLVTRSLGIEIVVKPLEAIRTRYSHYPAHELDTLWEKRRGRYQLSGVRQEELQQALRTYLAIKEILEEEGALGFGVNCFGDLIIRGGRDVPCLAQTLLREDGYIASCDGDYLAMTSMVLTSFFLDKPCMMSNMYPIQYVGALKDHFGDPLSPDPALYPPGEWKNLARLGHCGFVGVISPEMDPAGVVSLRDWGGTYEIKRDGRGCGNAGKLASGQAMTAIELKFDGRTLLVAEGEVAETTPHAGMPHCELTALLRFKNLEAFVENISREHTVIVYGDYREEFKTLARVLGLDCRIF